MRELVKYYPAIFIFVLVAIAITVVFFLKWRKQKQFNEQWAVYFKSSGVVR